MLLDFGIARLQGDADESGPQALTPRYASPEQLAGATPTIATDVHGLGCLLRELLEGGPLGPAAPRPLEWQAIVARATAAAPEARYDGVPALAADLRRYQQHRALAALPGRPGYRLAKALRRHWPWALAGGLASVALAGFTWQLVQERDRARAAEAQARQEQAVARQVSDFVVSLFEDADPGQARRPDLPATVLLDRGRQRVEAELRDQPALRATLQGVLGQAYDNLGQRARALELYTQAAALEADPAVARPLQEARLLGRMAVLLANDLEAARAEAPARRALALRQAGLPPGDPALADAMNDLGTVLAALQRFDEARPLLAEALTLRRRAFGDRSAEVATSLHNLGHLQRQAGDGAAAEPLFREALAIKRERLGEDHPGTLNSLEGVATALVSQQRLDEAVPLLEQLVHGRQKVHGAGSSHAAEALNELGVAEHDLGRLGPAIQHLQAAVATQRAAEGGDSLGLANKLNNLAHALADDGQAEMARNAFERSLALRLKHLGEQDLAVARARHNLGRWWLQQGQAATARPLIEQALAVQIGRAHV
jgi:serine/threonine-protein kinase